MTGFQKFATASILVIVWFMIGIIIEDMSILRNRIDKLEKTRQTKQIETKKNPKLLEGTISAEYHNAVVREMQSKINFYLQSFMVISSRIKKINSELDEQNEELERLIVASGGTLEDG